MKKDTLLGIFRSIKFMLRHPLYAPYMILFNFYYLPFKQAIIFPIWILSRNKKWPKGTISIASSSIHSGMIQLGLKSYFFHKPGLYYENRGGNIVFKGSCFISNESVIDVRSNAELIIGDKFGASITKFFCTKKMDFGNNVAIGMNCTFMDSNFHAIVDIYSKRYLKASIPIVIGNNNWFGSNCLIKKGTHTPNNIIISTMTILDKKIKVPEFSIIGTKNSVELLSEGFTTDFDYKILKLGPKKLTEEELNDILNKYSS